MLCFFLQIVCPNCTTLVVTGYEIDSKTEGAPNKTGEELKAEGK